VSNRQIVIAQIPDGPIGVDHFVACDAVIPAPGPGEVLCRTILVSLDPVNRGLMRGGGDYRGGLGPGDVMAGFGIAEVIDAGDTGWVPGALVLAETGWQQYAAVPAGALSAVGPQRPLSHALSALGVSGMTAWFGLHEIGRPVAGETVVVSAAAGATGHVAGQLARLTGCRTVGIVGSPAKAEALRELGFDACVVRDEPRVLRARLREACPDGIDVYFDSVGGGVLDACLALMRRHGRVVCCGTLSAYDSEPPPGPRGVPGLVISKRLRLEGFVVLDHRDRWPAAQQQIADWVADGRLTVLEEIDDGLHAAPQAFVDVLAGANLGKRMVRVAPNP
jgi:NADPH-dependent curcumin reductase CurA